METLLDTLLGILLGALLMYYIYSFFKRKRENEHTQVQATVLLERIQSVCKLVTVEGQFAEIFHHENTKQHFMGLISSKKKALIVVKAKVLIGFDLKKMKLHANTQNKKISITEFPQPEVLSIEPDLNYYDIKNGLLNKFTSDNLTQLHQEAKQQILDKIPESDLMKMAKAEMNEALLLIEKTVETIGWSLDRSPMEITNRERQFLEN